ncbi:MAG: hypothetical protein COA90_08145 [Gammaproteobacteria bacterium]|nr:MAG: hypothetical protein COA90_08145 [Gammaproteobacteria bacterium]
MKQFISVVFILFSSITIANPVIETIQLNHRLASEILPEISPFLPKDANARAHDAFIIIKAEAKDIKQIRKLINVLDVPAQQLMVSVLNTDEDLTEHSNVVRWSTHRARNKEHSYQVQGLAGKPLLIMLGQDIPQQEQTLIISDQGNMAVQSTTHILSLNNGFQAIATILPNNQVNIEVHPRFAELNKRNGTVNRSEIISTIVGPAGEWLLLGQIDNQKAIEKSGVTRYHNNRQQQQTLYIKVELL